MEGTGVDSSRDLYEFICGFEVLRSDLGLISFDDKEFCFIVQFVFQQDYKKNYMFDLLDLVEVCVAWVNEWVIECWSRCNHFRAQKACCH